MAASASTPDLEERPTRLTGKKDGYSFEIWVKVDGEPVKVYGEAELDEGGSEAWIASEEGKPYMIGCRVKNDNFGRCYRGRYQPLEYPDLTARFSVDGTYVGGRAFYGVHSGSQQECEYRGRAMSAGKVQELLFAKPELTEDDTPGIPLERLATIQVTFYRSICTSRPWTPEDNATEWDKQPTGPINEKSKKDAMVGQVTKFGDLHKANNQTISSSREHPDDREEGFFKMQFHYGPKDLLQALGRIPLKISKAFGPAGLREDQPIVFNDEDELGPAGGSKKKDQAVASNEMSETARQIAALQAQLDALKEQEDRKRKAAEEEDTKPQIIAKMGKRLKVAKEEDNGFVDLTGDD